MKDSRSAFALKLILGFPIVGVVWTFIIYFLSDSRSLNFSFTYWVGGTGICIGILCILSKFIFQIIWWLWSKVIFLIDTSITWLTLPLFYFLVFTPFALLLRVVGKAGIKQTKNNPQSYWKDVEQSSSSKQYLRQF